MIDLKQIIQEEYNLIDETHESINELMKLVDELINFIVENNLPYFDKQKKFPGFIFGTYMSAINHNNYNILENFIMESGKLVFQFEPKKSTVKGDYQTYKQYDGEKFDPRRERAIRIFYDEEYISNFVNRKYEEKGDLKDYELKSLFKKEFESALLHELQHAYDDYRSGGKIYQTKQWEDYLEKYGTKIDNAIKDTQIDTIKKYKEYVNLPHEIWARFIQTISEIKFFEAVDFDEKTENFVYEMNPLNDVIKKFINRFVGLHDISEEMKRKLIKRVAQFWHLEKEKIEKS